MVNTGSPVNGMNRGVVIDSVKLELGTKHTEANSILQVMGPQEMYLGLMKQWQNYQLINTPILAATELEKNVIYTKSLGQRLSYSVPTKFTLPYTTDDINEDSKVGLGKEKFYLILNTNRYNKSDVLTYDFEDGKQAQVALDEPENPVGYGAGSYLYTMRLTSDDPKEYISRRFTKPGVEWVKVSNGQSEWSTEASSINLDSDGLETLMFQTGDALQSVEHWMTAHADIIDYKVNSTTGMTVDKSVMGKYANPHQAAVMYMFDTLNDPRDPYNPDRKKAKGADGSGIVAGSGTWMPMIMQWLVREQAKMQERFYMYSQGGTFTDARGTLSRFGLGYYPQLKESGNYHTYAKPDQLIPLLRQISGDLFFGRTDLPVHERRVKWKVGQGALIEAHKYFLKYFKENIMFPVWAQHEALKGMLTGDNMNLKYEGFRFTAVQMPECGIIEIEHDPALDWVGTKNQTSFIGNYSTKSYRVFIEDITNGAFSNAMPPAGAYGVGEGFDNGGNITLIKPINYKDVYTSFRIGTYCPDFLKTFANANGNTHRADMDENGFKVKMQWTGEVWLKDPSRSVLVELVDPLKTI